MRQICIVLRRGGGPPAQVWVRPGRKKVGEVWVRLVGIGWALMSLAFMFTSLAKVFTGPCRNVHLPSSPSGKKTSSAVEGVRRLIGVLPI